MFGKELPLSKFSTSEYDPDMGCCSCFGFLRKPYDKSVKPAHGFGNHFSQEYLLTDDLEDVDGVSYKVGADFFHASASGLRRCNNNSEETSIFALPDGIICRETPVKATHHVTRAEDDNGNKMINEYVREFKIGSGSYGKVVLYQSSIDGKRYAIKAFHKSRLSKLRVAPSETAMTDVLREVLIMKMLGHPNIVNLIEVIDDPDTDYFYMVLEYVEGKWICEGSGPPGGIGETTSRRYFRDVVAGLMYLHAHNIVHGDIKPENLLVTSNGRVKICDFSVSRIFEDDNDELRRSPGTPVFTAPECCLGLTYHGKAADVWALGVTLYCMTFGCYPFLGDTLQDTYDRIVNNPLHLPEDMDPELKDLLEGLLCKDPKQRFTLDAIVEHPWVVRGYGPIPRDSCRCQRGSQHKDVPSQAEPDSNATTDSTKQA